jgi:hypothetical protein
VVIYLNKEGDSVYPELAKISPQPVSALPWGKGKWRVVFNSPQAATNIILKGFVSINEIKYPVRSPGRTYSYIISTFFVRNPNSPIVAELNRASPTNNNKRSTKESDIAKNTQETRQASLQSNPH